MANPAIIPIRDASGNKVNFEPNLDPSKGAKQDAGNALLAQAVAALAALAAGPGAAGGATETTLAAILTKLIASPATAANQATLNAKDFATQTTLAAVLAAVGGATPAGENHLGSIGGNTSYVDVTLTVDTAAYVSGDVLSDRVAITNAMRVADGTGVLQSVTILDESDQASLAFDLVFLSADVTIGAVNAAVSITDNNARSVLGVVSVASSDFADLGVNKVATKSGVGLVVKPVTGSRSIYVAAVSRSTPTFAAATDVKLRLGFLQD